MVEVLPNNADVLDGGNTLEMGVSEEEEVWVLMMVDAVVVMVQCDISLCGLTVGG